MSSKGEKVIRAGLPDLLPRLWRYGLVLTRSQTAAEELTRATLKHAIESAEEYKLGSRLGAWAFLGMSNLRQKDLRDQQKDKKNTAAFSNIVDLPTMDKSTALDPINTRTFDLIMSLPEAQRRTVFLVYVEGYRYKEVAELLNVPIGTIIARLAAARRTINLLLSDRKSLPKTQSADG